VYAILPELRKSLIGKVIMIFIVALFSAYLSLSAVAFGGREIIEDFSGCQLLAFLVQVIENINGKPCIFLLAIFS